MATGTTLETPFHLRGFISPQHPAAWKAMKWHDTILSTVFQDLDCDPPEYILVTAPALSGKTTFAMQFRARAASERPDIFTVYTSLGAVSTLATLLHQIRQSFIDQVGELLDSMKVQDMTLELSETLASWGSLEFEDLQELLRGLIRYLPDRYRRVVLMLDDCDQMLGGGDGGVADTLRAIHADRITGPLRGFSIIILGRSLLRRPGAASPLANVVKLHKLKDFSHEDVTAFLRRCGNAL